MYAFYSCLRSGFVGREQRKQLRRLREPSWPVHQGLWMLDRMQAYVKQCRDLLRGSDAPTRNAQIVSRRILSFPLAASRDWRTRAQNIFSNPRWPGRTLWISVPYDGNGTGSVVTIWSCGSGWERPRDIEDIQDLRDIFRSVRELRFQPDKYSKGIFKREDMEIILGARTIFESFKNLSKALCIRFIYADVCQQQWQDFFSCGCTEATGFDRSSNFLIHRSGYHQRPSLVPYSEHKVQRDRNPQQ